MSASSISSLEAVSSEENEMNAAESTGVTLAAETLKEPSVCRKRSASDLYEHVVASKNRCRRASFRRKQSDAHKRKKVHRTFLQLSQLFILFAILIIIYYDTLMILPHISSIFWAYVWAIFLNKPRSALLSFHRRIARSLSPYLLQIVSIITIAFAVTLAVSGVFGALMTTFTFVLLLSIIFGNQHTVVASFLLAMVVIFIAFPLGVVLKSSAQELDEMIRRGTDFIRSNEQVQQVFEDFGSSSLYRWIDRYAGSWGYQLPPYDREHFRDQAVNAILWAGHNAVVFYSGAVNVVSTTGGIMLSFFTFLSFLWYLLKQPRSMFSLFDGLSPFSEQDTNRLLESAKKSLSRACVCSLIIGALHTLVTFVTCRICGLEFITILSVLSGFLSMLPIISSWVVWVPVSLGLYFSGSTFYAILLASVHLFLEIYVDVLILSFIPGNAYFVGLSVVMGIYVFGVGGALAGPLLAGFSATVLDIYRDYVSSDFDAGEIRRVPSPSTSIKQEAVGRSARSKSLFQPLLS